MLSASAGLMAGPDGYDLSTALWHDAGWAEVADLRKRLENLTELRDLVRQLGRASGRGPKRRAPQEVRSQFEVCSASNNRHWALPQAAHAFAPTSPPCLLRPKRCAAGGTLLKTLHTLVAKQQRVWRRRPAGGGLGPLGAAARGGVNPLLATLNTTVSTAGGGQPAAAGPDPLGAAAGGDCRADAQRRPLSHAPRRGAPAGGRVAARRLRWRCAHASPWGAEPGGIWAYVCGVSVNAEQGREHRQVAQLLLACSESRHMSSWR